MVISVKTKRWGNSIGVIIPSDIVERLSIKPEEKINIEIEKGENVLKELFGAMPFKDKKSTEQILKESREEMEGKWMR